MPGFEGKDTDLGIWNRLCCRANYFLFDTSFELYQPADDICSYFGTSKSTVSQKAKMIRDLIGMDGYWDPKYSTSRMMNKNPFERFLMPGPGFKFT
ncbi:hypothetical protein KHC33_16415 [Methanospirillum sp. J.3.6.1-F.2.7.3]|uniref:DUF6398 domain-containing protein n=1 Tax=Methanospirillum purgamenti TaxID=2834276 RepID=A0A8E7AYX4_9EURY|nr:MULTISPECIES: DUF6398 domain-containing protein [Methanospirillum]MDX8549195.1 DUF6398 domain-containing protein [Methanospirillum hungatei]QVV88864.1 hypothetical protein KHC33_16415 [Methanospirillum sp. J.3.6.1-F.2.7.3]